MLDSVFLLLGQNEKITNWFTPIWVISLGVSAGFLLTLIYVAMAYAISKIGGLNQIGGDRRSLMIGGSITGAILVGLAFVLPMYFLGWRNPDFKERTLGYMFLIPLLLLVGFGSWVAASKARIDETIDLMREGFLKYVSYICLGMMSFAAIGLLLGLFSQFGMVQLVENPRAILHSLSRLPYSGLVRSPTFEIPPSPPGHSGDPIPIDMTGTEVRTILFHSNQLLDIASEPITTVLNSERIFQVPSTSIDAPVVARPTGRIPDGRIDKLYVANRGSNTAELRIVWYVAPAYPEVNVIPRIAVWVSGFFVLTLCGLILMPKISAISLSTFKTEIGQPLFMLVLLLGAVFVVLSIYVPYNTFGEDIKMYKDSGLTLIRVLAIFTAIWAASKSVSEEIEGRTALTVLSKPVGRREFIIGKFFGISTAMALLFIALGLWFVIWVSYKPVYDAVETSENNVQWADCFSQAYGVIPALVLGFLEVVVFVALSVAISTRFGILANLMICFSIYVLGHLTPQMVQSNQLVQAFEPVVFFGQVVSIIFPVLDHFDAQAAINTNRDIPLDYLGWSCVYTMLYGSMALLLALVLFEDRDLA